MSNRTAYYEELLAQANGNIERAVSMLYMDHEHFDGETIIGLSAEIRMRSALGYSTVEAYRQLAEAEAEEARWMAEYAARR